MVCTSHGDVDGTQRVGVTGALNCTFVVEGERLSSANHDERKRAIGEGRVHDIALKKEEINWLFDQT